MKNILAMTILIVLGSQVAVAEDFVCAAVVPPCLVNADGSIAPAAPYNEGPCAKRYEATCKALLQASCEPDTSLIEAIVQLKSDYTSLSDKYRKLKRRLEKERRR